MLEIFFLMQYFCHLMVQGIIEILVRPSGVLSVNSGHHRPTAHASCHWKVQGSSFDGLVLFFPAQYPGMKTYVLLKSGDPGDQEYQDTLSKYDTLPALTVSPCVFSTVYTFPF